MIVKNTYSIRIRYVGKGHGYYNSDNVLDHWYEDGMLCLKFPNLKTNFHVIKLNCDNIGYVFWFNRKKK